jgi:porin
MSVTVRRSTIGAWLLMGALVARVAVAEDGGSGLLPLDDYGGSLAKRAQLSGDWGGKRTDLAAKGFSVDWSLLQFGAANDGGLESDAYYGIKSEALFALDLDRAGILPGALVTLRAESRAGNSANTTSGAFLPVNDAMFFPQPPDDDFALYVTELRYTQFLSPTTGVFVGKFTTLGGDLNEFAGGRGDSQFLTFNGNSVSALFGPYSTVGVGAFYNPSPTVNLATSLVASTDSSSRTGLDTLDDGLIWTLNGGLQYRLGRLPGGIRGSFQYAFDNRFYNFDRGPYLTPEGVRLPFVGDTWAFVANGWQYLYVKDEAGEKSVNLSDGRQDRPGVGVWFRAGVADEDTNPVRWGLTAGLGGKGLVGGRPDDTFGIGVAYAEVRRIRFITDRLIEPTGRRLEAYYDAPITPAVHVSLHYNEVTPLLKGIDTSRIVTLRLTTSL